MDLPKIFNYKRLQKMLKWIECFLHTVAMVLCIYNQNYVFNVISQMAPSTTILRNDKFRKIWKKDWSQNHLLFEFMAIYVVLYSSINFWIDKIKTRLKMLQFILRKRILHLIIILSQHSNFLGIDRSFLERYPCCDGMSHIYLFWVLIVLLNNLLSLGHLGLHFDRCL